MITKIGHEFTPAEPECFYCYAAIEKSPYILWRGSTEEELCFHPACVVDFCLRLLRDVYEIEGQRHLVVQLVGEPRLK